MTTGVAVKFANVAAIAAAEITATDPRLNNSFFVNMSSRLLRLDVGRTIGQGGTDPGAVRYESGMTRAGRVRAHIAVSVPLVLGAARKLFGGVGRDLALEQVRAFEPPG